MSFSGRFFSLCYSREFRAVLLVIWYIVSFRQFRTDRPIASEQDLPIGTLAQRLVLDASVVTGIVKRLESHGLVERVHDRTDYRLVRLHLTGEGQELTHALATAATSFNQHLLRGFSHEERELLLQQLTRIRANALSTRGEVSHLDAPS